MSKIISNAPRRHISSAIVNVSPEILGGTPCFTGTRVPVKTLFDYLGAGDSIEKFLDDFPRVTYAQATGLLAEIGEEFDEMTESA